MEITKKILRATVKNLAETILRSRENSTIFLVSPNVPLVEREIGKMSTEIADEFVRNLDERGALREGNSISKSEFESLFGEVVNRYLGRNHGDKR